MPSDEPSAVALTSHRQSCRPRAEVLHHVAETTQRRSAVLPRLGQRLRCGTIGSGSVSVRDGSGADLPTREIEGDGLDDRSACIHAYEKVSSYHVMPSERPGHVAETYHHAVSSSRSTSAASRPLYIITIPH